jgi:hypothetical protein
VGIEIKGNSAGEGQKKITAAVHEIKQTRAAIVYYFDKTRVNQNHTFKCFSKMSDSSCGPQVPTGKDNLSC